MRISDGVAGVPVIVIVLDELEQANEGASPAHPGDAVDQHAPGHGLEHAPAGSAQVEKLKIEE